MALEILTIQGFSARFSSALNNFCDLYERPTRRLDRSDAPALRGL